MLGAGSTAPDVRTGSFHLSSELQRGRIVLVLFKISCPTCQFTLPFLDRLRENGARVVGVSQDDEASTREFTGHFGIAIPMLFDGKGCPIGNSFGITHVPSSFLVEPDLRISWSLEGFHKTELERLGSLLGGSPFRPGERLPAMRPG